MTKREIKSTDNGFIITDEHDEVIHEWDWVKYVKQNLDRCTHQEEKIYQDVHSWIEGHLEKKSDKEI